MTGLFLSMVIVRATVAGPASVQFEPVRCANHSLHTWTTVKRLYEETQRARVGWRTHRSSRFRTFFRRAFAGLFRVLALWRCL